MWSRDFMVADGTSTGFLTRLWARLLTQGFGEQPGDAFERWDGWLGERQQVWLQETRQTVEKAKDYFVTRCFEKGDSASATPVALRFHPDDQNRTPWSALVLGDSCLFHLRADGRVHSYALTHSSQFTSVTKAVDSYQPPATQRPRRIDSTPSADGESSHATPGDCFLLATDTFPNGCSPARRKAHRSGRRFSTWRTAISSGLSARPGWNKAAPWKTTTWRSRWSGSALRTQPTMPRGSSRSRERLSPPGAAGGRKPEISLKPSRWSRPPGRTMPRRRLVRRNPGRRPSWKNPRPPRRRPRSSPPRPPFPRPRAVPERGARISWLVLTAALLLSIVCNVAATLYLATTLPRLRRQNNTLGERVHQLEIAPRPPDAPASAANSALPDPRVEALVKEVGQLRAEVADEKKRDREITENLLYYFYGSDFRSAGPPGDVSASPTPGKPQPPQATPTGGRGQQADHPTREQLERLPPPPAASLLEKTPPPDPPTPQNTPQPTDDSRFYEDPIN